MDSFRADYWHLGSDGRIECEVCPRACRLKDGQRGLCFVRQRIGSQMILTTYGRSSGFCIDPVEKKPLNHFYPGSPILSFGTAGCNLSCKFCQNWDLAASKDFDRMTDKASPMAIAQAAKDYGCSSVALTYNDPVIFLEYGRDVAQACHELDIKVVAVTNAYIWKQARKDFFSFIDAANVDLKAFTNEFYKTLTGGDLQTVLDTLVYLKKETKVWIELTTLIIPGENDSEKELTELSQWVVNELGPETPIHFSAFHPDFKMREKSATSLDTVVTARNIALDQGLFYVYTGNVYYSPGDTTYCKSCGKPLIERDWYNLTFYRLDANANCIHCGTKIAGRFASTHGNWGSKRRPIRV
ncbi:MAG: AmmeMemoRadiSam system radical SAM enzyme [Proteobacteria bacterium]|nr:AmmeMemoRadiSam system radical SAM enzyme [Pseudomonadota bacterium]